MLVEAMVKINYPAFSAEYSIDCVLPVLDTSIPPNELAYNCWST
jgi:hypothetical protein